MKDSSQFPSLLWYGCVVASVTTAWKPNYFLRKVECSAYVVILYEVAGVHYTLCPNKKRSLFLFFNKSVKF